MRHWRKTGPSFPVPHHVQRHRPCKPIPLPCHPPGRTRGFPLPACSPTAPLCHPEEISSDPPSTAITRAIRQLSAGSHRHPQRATNRRGLPCQCTPLPGKKRCKHHGGLSTGPRTAEGKDKARESLVKARAALAGPEHEEARRLRSLRGWTTRRKREKEARWAARFASLPARWMAALERIPLV